MRLTKEQAAQNREKIIETADRVFRERGIDGVSVADLMKEAGFTHGGFYNHFASKQELVAEASRAAFAKSMGALLEQTSADKNGRQFAKGLQAYLSPAHRDDCTGGCPAAAFLGEVSRQGCEMQSTYAQGIKAFLEVYESQNAIKCGTSCKATAREKAIDVLANLVGSLLLARAVVKADPALSDEILAAGRRQLPK